MKVWQVGLLALQLGFGPVRAQEPFPVGSEFQVNVYTTGRQGRYPSVAVDSTGNFVVVCASYGSLGTDTSDYSVQSRRFDSTGSAFGPEFQVNTTTFGYQFRPVVDMASNGDFVVVWDSDSSGGSDTSAYSVQGQRFGSDGAPLAAEFQINSYTTDAQQNVDVALSNTGEFVAVWSSAGSSSTDTSAHSIQAQRFASNGTTVGQQIQVNSFTTGRQTRPAVGMAADGSFVVAWESGAPYIELGQDGSFTSVQAQRFAQGGTPVNGEFQVNTYTTSNQWYAELAVSDHGDFIIVWRSNGSSGSDNSLNSIQGQLFDSDGNPTGGEFQVNTVTTGYQGYSEVVSAGDHYLVSWHSAFSSGFDTSGFSIQGQFLDLDGAFKGGEFQVNTYTTSDQFAPSAAVNFGGDLVIIWQSDGSNGTDNDSESVQGQLFAISIFRDGFESGDTSAWSNTKP